MHTSSFILNLACYVVFMENIFVVKNGDILEGAGHIANVTQTIAGIAGAEDVANVANIVGDSANLAGKAVDIGGDAVKVAKHCCTVM